MQNRSRLFPRLGRALAFSSVLAFAATFAQADSAVDVQPKRFPSLSLNDQHDRPVTLPGSARWILFAHTRDGDEWSDRALAEFGQSGMTARGLVYLSDISAMPSLVSKMFAMPALRGRKYSVALIREEGKAKGIPARKDCVSLIGLNDGRIEQTRQLCSAEAVKQAVDHLPPR